MSSTWGTWLEKGKQLAANIDQQLNESVGIETPTATAPSTTSYDTNNNNSHEHEEQQDQLNDDAWNDDEFVNSDIDKPHHNQGSPSPAFAAACTPVNHPGQEGWSEADEEIVLEESSLLDQPEKLSSSSSPPAPLLCQEPILTASPESFQQQEQQQEPSPTTDALKVPPVVEPTVALSMTETLLNVALDTRTVTEEEESPLETTTMVDPTSFVETESPVHTPESPSFHEEPEVQVIPPNDDQAGWEEDLYVDEEEEDEEPGEVGPEGVVQEHETEDREKPHESPVNAPVLVKENYVASTPVGAEPLSNTPQEAIATPDVIANGDVHDGAQEQQWTEEKQRLQEEHDMTMALVQSQMDDLQRQLQQREDQLESKMEQFITMQSMLEGEKEELRRKVAETKEEAKKRISMAKERVEAMERRMQEAVLSAGTSSGEQEKIIAALREEGQNLARKQSEMEKAVRSAKGETRELSSLLETEADEKNKALEKISALEAQLKQTKEDLAGARRGESQAGKLEADLASAREQCQVKAAANLSLEQQVKELKAETKGLTQEVEEAKRGAARESQMESKKIKKEHGNLLSDLEAKLRTSEREAGLREDALRHEVSELRKRWQDAVRRADALSMDVQQSTAPLLRQLESMERQNRARAAAWAELETKLRSDLEENVIENERLSKERNDLKATNGRLQRMMKERDEEISTGKSTLSEQADRLKHLEKKLSEMEAERQKLKEEYNEIEKLANEGVSKVRSDMMKTVVETEERYRSQTQAMEKELREEQEKRSQLERQVEQMLENTGAIPLLNREPSMPREVREKQLRSTTGQAEILASTLTGMDSDDEGDDRSVADVDFVAPVSGGFAAMEQLSQRLKGAMVELEALRKQLTDSERTRESLVQELSETRQAREKLPLFEAKVKELSQDNREKELELLGLREDISEVRQLYRSQLNGLLEEKAAALQEEALNGGLEEPPLASIDEEISGASPESNAPAEEVTT